LGFTAPSSEVSEKPPAGCGSPVLSIHYENAYKTLHQAEQYSPGNQPYYVEEMDDQRNEYLLAGISPKFRTDWLAHKIGEKNRHCFLPVLDAINTAAKRTLPEFKPRGWDGHAGNDDKLIREVAQKKFPGAVVLDAGTKGSWEIEKLYNGIPKRRFEHGMVWVKSPSFDDGYCRIVHVNIVQDYAGGGGYTQSRAVYINELPVGCK
jgi:hypothetical protein